MAEGKYKVSQKGEDGGVPGTLSGMPGLRAKKLKGRLPPARPFCHGMVVSVQRWEGYFPCPSPIPVSPGHFRLVRRHPGK